MKQLLEKWAPGQNGDFFSDIDFEYKIKILAINGNASVLVLLMAWHPTGNKTFSESMMSHSVAQ